MTDRNSSAPVQVDAQSTDNDSTYGNELSTYSASLTSSVRAHRYENGRRYHTYRDGSYLLPNDEQENDRLDMGHELTLRVMDRKLFLAPIGPSPQRVLDIATGTGIWAVDFADEYPSAEVLGNDLSPIQPTMVPPNLKFHVDDIEAEWGYENTPFDFIHGRYLAASVKDFPRLVKQAYDCTKSGGWVEFQDWDMSLRSEDGSLDGTDIEKYYKALLPAFEKAGYNTRPGPSLEKWFQEAGFINIGVKQYRVPLGNWPKDPYYKTIGTWFMMQAEQGFEGVALAVLTRFESWEIADVVQLAAGALQDARNRKIHGLYDFYVVYGQKP